MSDTPETDAAAWTDTNWENACVRAKFARKLERERDEALEKIKQQKLEIVRLNGATNHAGGTPLKIALRERDEAREELKKLEGAYEDATNYYARMIELKDERDEALKNLEEEMKFHHRTHSELVKANCKILDLQMQLENQKVRIGELMDFGNKLADECDRILGLGLHQNTLLRFKDALESWRKNI